MGLSHGIITDIETRLRERLSRPGRVQISATPVLITLTSHLVVIDFR
jgi:hypothetical protein